MYDPTRSCLAEVCNIFHARGYCVLYLSRDIGTVHYTLTRNMSHASAGQYPSGSYIVADVCIYNLDNINNYKFLPEEADYCLVITAIWTNAC